MLAIEKNSITSFWQQVFAWVLPSGIWLPLVLMSFINLGGIAQASSQQLQSGSGLSSLVVKPEIEHQATSRSKQNMVATVHPLATEAGLKALAQGGNAIDAAVAAGLTLGVVDGFNSGIGGGCFILIHTADGQVVAIDGREMAPAAAHPDLFKEAAQKIKSPSRTGPLASGVPGALAAFYQANVRHGNLKFSQLIRPAAEIAERGFLISKTYEAKIRTAEEDIRKFPGTARVLLRPGKTGLTGYQAGERLVQKDLAKTYREIADKGPSWFYNGPFATQTATWMKAHGGIMTEADFANYRTVDRAPIRSRYRGYDVIGFPPPSSGGVHVAQILNILESFDLEKIYEQNPAEMYHLVAEAMKLAFADRAHWLGDPDFVNVPRGLVDPQYANRLAKLIDRNKASEVKHGNPPGKDSDFFQSRHTTHLTAADAEGNWVAITSTVNTTFGSKVVVPGLGVVMNNQMDDFVAIPDQPNAFGLVGGRRNAVEAKKRPLSSMSPTILLKDGRPVLTLGAAGGPKIITEVVNAIIHHVDLGKPINDAIRQPRIHHQWAPNVLMVERGVDSQVIEQLRDKGHEIRMITAAGICQGISRDEEGFLGAADPRTESSAGGTNLLPTTRRQKQEIGRD